MSISGCFTPLDFGAIFSAAMATILPLQGYSQKRKLDLKEGEIYCHLCLLTTVDTHGLCELGHVISHLRVLSLPVYKIRGWGWMIFKTPGRLKILPRETHSRYQFSSVAQLCPTLCDPMNCSTPGLPVHHQLPEFTQTRVHRVGDAIQPFHLLSSPSPPTPSHSQHQCLFQ